MVIFDVAVSFLAGGVIGRRSKGKGPGLALAAGTLGIGPAAMIFLELYPDWDWQYLVDPADVPGGFSGIFLLAIGLAALAGHAVGSRRLHPAALWGAGGVFALYLGWSILRLPYVGTKAQYLADTASFLPTPFLVHLAIVCGPSAAIILWCVWKAAPEKT